jgi:hypothetical protein
MKKLEKISTEAKNIPEFIALIHRYETITLKEIKEELKLQESLFAAENLTGFGDSKTCTLCIAVKKDCNECVYNNHGSFGCLCYNKKFDDSYYRIRNAKTARKLFNAYHNRAKVLREFAKEKNINID